MKGRNPRQCKERFNTYLHPSIKIGDWTYEEDEIILRLVNQIGRKWVQISRKIPNRTDTAVKNRYHILSLNQEKENTSPSTSELNSPSICNTLKNKDIFNFSKSEKVFDLFYPSEEELNLAFFGVE